MPNQGSSHSLRSFAIVLIATCFLSLLAWGNTPEPNNSGAENPARDEAYLNGVWDFSPGATADKAGALGADDWGKIGVPGSWKQRYGHPPEWVKAGKSPLWKEHLQSEGGDTTRGLYRTTIQSPASLKGQRLQLILERVSTDAKVYLDGKEAGRVKWPGGVIDLTPHVRPGKAQELLIEVLATDDRQIVEQFMDATDVHVVKASLNEMGLIGNVLTRVVPEPFHIRDLEIEPSYLDENLALELLVPDLAGQKARTSVRLYEPAESTVAFEAEKEIQLDGEGRGVLTVSTPGVRPWSPEDPFLYLLAVTLTHEETIDRIDQQIGFRDFSVEGRQFSLNGKPYRLRPYKADELDGIPEIIENHLRNLKKAGFNTLEIWPQDFSRRGGSDFYPEVVKVADKVGMLVFAPTGRLGVYTKRNRHQWESPASKGAYLEDSRALMRKYRNHPSVIGWVGTPNFFGNALDQDPRRIGRDVPVPFPDIAKRTGIMEEALGMLRELDSTRPFINHHGGFTGDFQTINLYLNFIPLQERREWFTHWAEHGDAPVMAVEFGTPFFCTFLRGRKGFHDSSRTEPWLTEFAAIYLGPEAYEQEEDAWRREIATYYDKLPGPQYSFWPNSEVLYRSKNHQAIQDLFIRETWRHWRAQGMSGGMIPWDFGKISGQDFASASRSPIPLETRRNKPGRQVVYLSEPERRGLDPDAHELWDSFSALKQNNQPTLAFIGGPESDPHSQRHHYKAGETLAKQVFLLNDSEKETTFKVEVSLGEGDAQPLLKTTVTLAPAEIRAIPFSTAMPSVDKATDVSLHLRAATETGVEHVDIFALRAYPKANPAPQSVVKVAIIDPEGDTRSFAENWPGVELTSYDNSLDGFDALIVGRRAFSQPELQLPSPEQLSRFAERGGKILVFGQEPKWYTEGLGLRRGRNVARSAWPVPLPEPHEITRGLDATDLRDWAGSGSLIDPRPKYEPGEYEKGMYDFPYSGWRWGTSGSVSSVPLEIPHQSGLQPLLQTEFDMAYSPLLELRRGQGSLLLITLDLENREDEPVVEALGNRLAAYLASDLPAENGRTVVASGPQARALLQAVGVVSGTRGSPAETLLVIGEDSDIDQEELDAFLQGGGHALLLARSPEAGPEGFATVQDYAAAGEIPDWPETAGLTTSMLRLRSPVPVPLLQEGHGYEIAAAGILGRRKLGQGVAIALQLDEKWLDTEKKPYLRFSAWRTRRALSQVLANLGARFPQDDRFFDWRASGEHPGSTGFYHPDYVIEDYNLSDDPYRYYRW